MLAGVTFRETAANMEIANMKKRNNVKKIKIG